MIVLGVITAWLLADFLSGAFHWWEDRYGNPEWPILGRHIVQPNIEHHEFPTRMLEGNYWVRNSTTILPAAFGAIVAWLVGCPWWIVLAFAFLTQGNQVHAWAHSKPPAIVRFLQRANVFIRATDHQRHHRHPFNTDFCTMSPLLNPILSAVRFWQGLEAGLRMIGIKTFADRADQRRAA